MRPSAEAGGLFLRTFSLNVFFQHGARRSGDETQGNLAGCFIRGADRRRVCAETGGVAQPDDPGELRVGDYAYRVRCQGESAEVQERASDVSERVRRNCGGEEVKVSNHRGHRGTQRLL